MGDEGDRREEGSGRGAVGVELVVGAAHGGCATPPNSQGQSVKIRQASRTRRYRGPCLPGLPACPTVVYF